MKSIVIILILFFVFGSSIPLSGQIIWSLQYAQNDPGATDAITLNDVFFIDGNTGWACGTNGMMAGAIFKTTNSGVTWTILKSTSMFDSFSDFEYIDADTMWAAGSKGMGSDCLLYKTTDGGSTWNVQSFPLNESMTGIKFVDSNTGYAFLNEGYVPKIYKTTDGGANWTEVFDGTTDDGWSISKIYCYFMIDGDNIYAAGQNGHAFHTTDGGTTWNYVDNQSNANINGMYFLDTDRGWMVGGSDVMLTTDGATWQVIDIDHANVAFTDICFTNANNGFFVGGNVDDGLSYSTIDGGLTWTADSLASNYDLNKLFFLNENNGWIVGDKGVVHKYSSGGTTGIRDDKIQLPDNFILEQNYPNPFNPMTNISFKIPKSSVVKMEIYNLSGQLIKTLVSGKLPSGTHQLEWDGMNNSGIKVSSGVYIYRLQAGNIVLAKKMIMIK